MKRQGWETHLWRPWEGANGEQSVAQLVGSMSPPHLAVCMSPSECMSRWTNMLAFRMWTSGMWNSDMMLHLRFYASTNKWIRDDHREKASKKLPAQVAVAVIAQCERPDLEYVDALGKSIHAKMRVLVDANACPPVLFCMVNYDHLSIQSICSSGSERKSISR